jgi:hypothetical protein
MRLSSIRNCSLIDLKERGFEVEQYPGSCSLVYLENRDCKAITVSTPVVLY